MRAERCAGSRSRDRRGAEIALPTVPPVVAAVIQLQRTAGNRAVAGLLARPRLSARGGPVLQRQPFGLAKVDQVTDFANLAVDFWRANPDKTLAELGTYLTDKANDRLGANNVPRVSVLSFGTVRKHSAGGFGRSSWTLQVDLAKIATKPLTTKLSDLTVGQLAEVAGITYHEARHAEQAFYVARLVASAGKPDGKTLATELDMPVSVAEAAIKAGGVGKAETAKVEEWRAFGKGGKHHDYWDWNETFRGFVANVVGGFKSPSPAGVQSVTDALDALAPTLAGWRKDSLPFPVSKISALEKVKKPDAADKVALRDLKKIRAGLEKVFKAEKKLADAVAAFKRREAAATTKPITVAEARVFQADFELLWLKLEIALRELQITTDDAYRSYPEEADAYAVQKAVEKAFAAKANPPAKTKPAPKRKEKAVR